METTNETVVPNHYNPNQIVTYKVIDSEAHESDIANWYPTVKVSQIEWDLEQKRYNTKSLAQYIYSDYAYLCGIGVIPTQGR